MLKILIVDGLNRSGLAVSRALRMAGGCRIFVTAPSLGLRDIILRRFKSNSIESVFFTTGKYHTSRFIDELKQLVINNQIDAVIPVGQAAAVSLSSARSELSGFCKVLIEDYVKLSKFHDKAETALLLEEFGIPHPATFIPEGEDSIHAYTASANFPVVIKARKGMGSTGIWYAANERELIDIYRKRISNQNPQDDGFITDSSDPIIQEYIPGELHDALVYCVDGEVRAALTQKRLVTRPTDGGIGIVNITTHDERLLDYARRIARQTSWNGVLMLDFKIDDRDGEPKLLEVNPRFWGTTWLSILAGMNFPGYLVADAFSEPAAYCHEYESGLACRWIMDEFAAIFDSPLTLSGVLKGFKEFITRFKDSRYRYDVIMSDLKPALGEMINLRLLTDRQPR